MRNETARYTLGLSQVRRSNIGTSNLEEFFKQALVSDG